MKRLSVFAAAGLLAAIVGCKKGADDAGDKFDRIMARLDAMDKKLDQVAQGRGAGARPPSPAEPDPRATYSIPVSDADFPKGPATAKVTIVEAADFA
jgi:hypothetical protein